MNVGLLAYFPLAIGLLTGRYKPDTVPPPDSRAAALEWTRRYVSEYSMRRHAAILDKLTEFAQQRGHTLADL